MYAVLVVSYDMTDRKRAEEALRANEERFRTLVENVRDYAIFMTDAKGAVTEWTAGAERVKGYTAEEAIGRHLSAFYAPEDLAAGDPARELAEAAREGRAEREGWRVRKSGERFWVNEIATAVRDESGGLVGFTKISRDLTEWRRTDQALRRAARADAYRVALADALRPLADPVGIQAEAARVLGEHLGANRVLYAEMLEDARTAVVEADYRREGTRSFVGRHRLDDFSPSVPEILGAGRTLVMHDYGEISDLSPEELAAYVAVGIYAHVSVPLVKAGRFAAFLSVHQSAPRAWTEDEVALIEETAERTWAAVEQARAEKDLRESNERLRLAVDAAGLGRWELIPETGKLLGDATWKEHHGAPPDSNPDFEGHVEAIHPEDRDAVRGGVARALGEGGGHEAEYRVLRPGGEVRWIFSRARVFRGGSAPDRLVGVTLDVTEGRELERERERLRARDLTARAEAAERERISRELHDRVAHSMGISHQSLELYAALAETAPSRAREKLELARETTRRVLDQTRSLAAELKRMQESELENGMEAAFQTLVETSVPDEVSVDLSLLGAEQPIPKPIAVQVYLVMREAVRNAVKHSGCRHLTIRLEATDRRVSGAVEDDGGGFDPDAAEKASPSWGVGLRSMRERATMLGGSLRVSSKPGEGTRVEVTVPLDAQR